jgi:pimeloyl-ACP methyl ester carboxylesterase
LIAAAFGQSSPAVAQTACGGVVSLATHDRTTTRYSLSAAEQGQISLVLLVGGGGHLNLDPNGCPRALRGNSLVRSLPHFHSTGFATALVDAPSDHPGEDGLKGFRLSSKHATDLGIVIADVRNRNKGPVWVVGTSRGTISAVNAAVRLTASASADGLVLTSAVTSGGKGGMRPWAVQTVFDVRLETIRMPVLVIGHAADKCPRTPPRLMTRITSRTNGVREQVVTVTGGPGSKHTGLEACQGRTPHGFIDQEAVVAAGIARFIRGGSY